MQSCLQQQRLGPDPSAFLHQSGDGEVGGHQKEVQIRPLVQWGEGALRPPHPLYWPAVSGEMIGSFNVSCKKSFL